MSGYTMTHVAQAPNLCYYACLESILKDKGIYGHNQRRLLALGKVTDQFGSYHKLSNRLREELCLSIVKRTNQSTSEILEHYRDGNVIATFNKTETTQNRQSACKLPNNWTEHAVRIAPGNTSNEVVIMDPYEALPSVFSTKRDPASKLITCPCATLDAMRWDSQKNQFLEYYVVCSSEKLN